MRGQSIPSSYNTENAYNLPLFCIQGEADDPCAIYNQRPYLDQIGILPILRLHKDRENYFKLTETPKIALLWVGVSFGICVYVKVGRAMLYSEGATPFL